MRSLAVNFVPSRRPVTLLGGVVLTAGLVLTGMVFVDFLDARAELERVEQRHNRLKVAAAKPRVAAGAPLKSSMTASATAPVSGRDEAVAAARLATQLNLPWDLVLREIESLGDPSVALLSVEAQGQARKIRITGEAKAMDDIVSYVSRLRQSRVIEAAHLAGHEVKLIGVVNLTRFSVDAVWSQGL